MRLHIYYTQLNNMTVKSFYHMPFIDDLLDQIQGNTIFPKIDFKLSNHQFRIMAWYIRKIVVRTRYVYYDFLVMCQVN